MRARGGLWLIGVAAFAVAAGAWVLSAERTGYLGVASRAERANADGSAPALHGAGDGGDAAGASSAELWVRVVGERGQPVSGASVAARAKQVDSSARRFERGRFEVESPTPLAQGRTDAAGDVRIGGLLPGAAVWVDVEAPAPYAGRRTVALTELQPMRPTTVVLEQGTPLQVRIEHPPGRPVQAQVTVHRRDTGLVGVPALPPTLTDPAGRARFEGVPGGGVWLGVAVPGVGRRGGIPVRTPASEDVVVTLGDPAGFTLRGTIRSDDGQPFAGALVRAVVRKAKTPLLRADRLQPTAADGRYRFEGLPVGILREIDVIAEGFAAPSLRALGRRVVQSEELVIDVRLQRESVVFGRVLTAVGDPIANARVYLGARARGASVWEPHFVVSDARGHYEVTGLAVGHVAGGAWKRGWHAVGDDDPPGPGPFFAWQRGARIDAPGQRVELDMVMTEGVSVAGTVVDAEDRGVVAAVVQVAWAFELSALQAFGQDLLTTTSDEHGAFEIVGIPHGLDVQLSARLGRAVSKPAKVRVGGPEARGVRLELPKTAWIVGQVRGAPPAGLWVRVVGTTSSPGSIPAHWRAPVRADGSFEVEDVPVGMHTVLLVGPGGVALDRRDHVEVLAQGGASGIELRAPRLVRIEGRVVDADGVAVAGLSVRAREVSEVARSVFGTSGVDGAFTVGPLLTGEYELSAQDLARRVRVTGGAQGVRLVVKRVAPRRVSLRVLLPGGQLVPRARASVRSLGDPARRQHTDILSVVQGALDVEVTPATEAIRVTIDRASDVYGEPLNVRPFESERLEVRQAAHKLRLSAGRRAEVRVVGHDGRGVPGAGVIARSPDEHYHPGSQEAWLRTDADGRVELVGLADRAVVVRVDPPKAYPRPPPTRLEARDRQVRIVLEPPALTIAGIVRGPEGAPLAGAQLWWAEEVPKERRRDRRVASATSGADGRFVLETIPSGSRGELSVAGPAGATGGSLVARRLHAVAAGTQGLVVQLDEGVRIEGTVVDPEGQPVSGAWVEVREVEAGSDGRGGFRRERYRTNPKGRFWGKPRLPGSVLRVDAKASGVWIGSVPHEVQLPSGPLRIALRAGLHVHGAITPEVAGVRLVFVQPAPDGERIPVCQQASSTDEGRFRMTLECDRPGVLYALDRARGRFVWEEGVVPGGGALALRLQAGATLRGTVAVRGRPGLIPAHVRVRSGVLDHAQAVAEDGTFEVRGLPPGRTYTVNAYTFTSAGQAEGPRVSDVAPGGGEVQLELEIP